jgi:hypothetical protein
MYILNFWHTVSDYGEWKKMFDADPLGREASGVRRYSLERPLDDEHMVIGELEFDSVGEAETFAGRLQQVWQGQASSVVSNAGYRITELLVNQELRGEGARKVA